MHQITESNILFECKEDIIFINKYKKNKYEDKIINLEDFHLKRLSYSPSEILGSSNT